MQKMLADAGRQLRDSSADANRIKELEAQAETLQAGLTANQARVADLQAQLAAPAYPDLSGRVGELERELTQAGSVAERARQEAAALARARDDAASEAREARQELAALREARESRQPAAPPYPDLRERVASLESALAETHRQLAEARIPSAPATVSGSAEDAEAVAKRLQETEDRLATALRGYALLEKDRDALQARARSAAEAAANETAQLNSRLTTLAAEVDQLKAAAAAQPDAGKLAAERDALAARLSETEARVASAQAEAARATEQLGALQRSSGQTSNEVAAARALIQQLQGSNAVLAQENYQLKTLLARNTGSAAPSAPSVLAAAPTAPGARSHLVVAGDSLSRISQRYYGNAGRWQEIYNANREKLGPNGVLRVGTELRIP